MNIFPRSLRLVGLALATTALFATTLPAHAARTVKISMQLGLNHPLGENVAYFKEQVEKLSNNEIQVQIYESAQLFKGSEIPQAVSSGAVDMGMVLVDEYAGTLPATGLFSVAFLFPDYDVLAKAAAPDSPVRQELDELIRSTGTRVLWWQDYGPIQLIAKKEPVVMPADMKGKKVRVLGKPSGDFIDAVGAVPVKIGGSEQFIAYQRGTVDIGMTGTTATQSRKLYEVMNYMTITNHAQVEFLMVINDKLWDSLSDDERQWMTEAARAAEDKMRAETRDQNVEAEQWLAQNTSLKITHLDDAQIKAWQDAAAPAIDAYVKEAGPVGQKLIDELKKLY